MRFHAFRQAPLEWIHQTHRMQASAMLACVGMAYIHWSLFADTWVIRGTLPCRMRAGMGLGQLVAAFVLYFVAIPPQVFERVICVFHALLSCETLWNESPGDHDAFFFVTATLLFSGVRVQPFLLCFLLNVFNLVGSAVVANNISSAWVMRTLVSTVVLLIELLSQHSTWRAVYEAQSALAAQKAASWALLRMASDAACWMAAESSKILDSSDRLDALMGSSMKGKQFCDCMPRIEAERFKLASLSTRVEEIDKPVVQLPSTLLIKGRSVQADLFIVDCRHAFSGIVSTEGLGFLIGIRLAVAEGSVVPPSTEELGIEVISRGEDDVSRVWRASMDQLHRRQQLDDLGTASADSARQGPSSVCETIPETLQSVELPAARTYVCSREDVEVAIKGQVSHTGFPRIPRQTQATLQSTLNLIFIHAQGGALIVIADAASFRTVFEDDGDSASLGLPQRKVARHCDEGYMTETLRGIHISEDRFANAFGEFTKHSDTDRWPLDYPDENARGKPKDGAWLISKSGYRMKCATKLLGLAPAVAMANVGTRHEAALSTAWAVPDSFVLVRSDSGSVHLIFRRKDALHVYFIHETA
mmetsp:Transcript_51901/g.150795  ORF Transcript_51901/g.150795 Transcript_51901/m.150795 type:complete len:588 (-) Transcript_51901:182-1945(-)